MSLKPPFSITFWLSILCRFPFRPAWNRLCSSLCCRNQGRIHCVTRKGCSLRDMPPQSFEKKSGKKERQAWLLRRSGRHRQRQQTLSPVKIVSVRWQPFFLHQAPHLHFVRLAELSSRGLFPPRNRFSFSLG